MAKTTLFVSTIKGLFRFESNDRKSWNSTGPVLKGWEVRDVGIDERDGTALYACVGSYVYGPCIHKSNDMGKTWTQIENGPAFGNNGGRKLNAVWTVVPGRRDEPGVLYAGVDEAALFKSPDSGNSWKNLDGLSEHETRGEWYPGAGGLTLHTILLHPTNVKRMWVGISAVGVFRTDDGGKTWQPKNDGVSIVIEGKKYKNIGTCVHRLVLDSSNPDILYQQNHQGVYKSTDGGDSWKTIENGLPGKFGFPMVQHPSEANTLFTIPQESDEFRFAKDGKLAVYRTTDGGDSWHAQRKGLPENTYVGVLRQAMTMDSRDEPGIYFGTNAGQVFYSLDSGENWQAIPATLPRIMSVKTLTID